MDGDKFRQFTPLPEAESSHPKFLISSSKPNPLILVIILLL